MNALVERVARAICESLESDIYDDLSENGIVKAAYRQQALAALKAMRNPTQEMLDAGFYPAIQRRGAKSVWGEMITAAIQEHSTPPRNAS